MIINIIKPHGWSSFDVVKKIKNITKHKKVGHAGTLDPFATGVLIIGTEKDTKKLEKISSTYKTYEAILELGRTTDTLDNEGKIIFSSKVPNLNKKIINRTLKSFLGLSNQIPPMFSAKRYNGKRLYEYARQGIKIERKPIQINIKEIGLIRFNKNSITFRVTCSKGTYIRVLGKNIAEKLNTIGFLSYLNRISVGKFKISNSISIQDFIKEWKL